MYKDEQLKVNFIAVLDGTNENGHVYSSGGKTSCTCDSVYHSITWKIEVCITGMNSCSSTPLVHVFGVVVLIVMENCTSYW